LFGLIFAGLLLRLWVAVPIWNRGEAREGLVVQGILHNHQWILPYRNGELPSKPPLFHWLAATASLALGENDFTLRLPSALVAVVMAWVTFVLGRAMGGRRTGWLAVGVLLGTYDFWHTAGQARVDMVFSAAVSGAIAGFYFWDRAGLAGARVACYLATIAAVLAKGPLGIVLIGLVIIAFLIVEKRLGRLWQFWSWPLVGLSLATIGAWYGLAYALGGPEFIARQIGFENIERLVGSEAFHRKHMYLNAAFWFSTRTLPWNLVLLWSVFQWRRGARENSDGHLLHAWWLTMVGFFSVAASVRPVYFLPLFPAIALLAGRGLNALISSLQSSASSRPERWRHPMLWVGTAVVVADLILMFVSYGSWRDRRQVDARIAFEKRLSDLLAPDAVLFAVQELEIDDVLILAFRLKRRVEFQPLDCARRDELFLVPMDAVAADRAQVLATLDLSKMALIRVIGDGAKADTTECQNSFTRTPHRKGEV
jgi:4-amino-4-deoxy-L-arabinose transferase-like glycosyltransferase